MCGLQYLHYNGIIHRDLKPANLLWTDATQTHVKISDFGVSHFSAPLFQKGRGLALEYDEKTEPLLQASPSPEEEDLDQLDQRELAHTAGSPAFFAPELCLTGASPLSIAQCQALGQKTPDASAQPDCFDDTPRLSQAIDAWALGVTLYCLLFGTLPFQSASEFGLFSVIPWYDYSLPPNMGSDQVQIGPRGLRWDAVRVQSAVQEQERISCVSISRYFKRQDEPNDLSSTATVQELHEDVNPEALSSDARALRTLLDGLLEKSPSLRIGLDEVKSSSWMTAGLMHPRAWIDMTDPGLDPYVPIYRSDVPDVQEFGGSHPALKKLKKSASANKLRTFSFGRSNCSALTLPNASSNERDVPKPQLKTKPARSNSESHGSIQFATLVRAQVDRMRARIKTHSTTAGPMPYTDTQEVLNDLDSNGMRESAGNAGIPHSHSGPCPRKFESLPITGKPKRLPLNTLFPDAIPAARLTPRTPVGDEFSTSGPLEANSLVSVPRSGLIDSPQIDTVPMTSDPSSTTSYLSEGSTITTTPCSLSSPAPSAMSEGKRSLPSLLHGRLRVAKPVSTPSLSLPLGDASTSGEIHRQRSGGSLASRSPETRSGQITPSGHPEEARESGSKLKLLILRRKSTTRHARRASATDRGTIVSKLWSHPSAEACAPMPTSLPAHGPNSAPVPALDRIEASAPNDKPRLYTTNSPTTPHEPDLDEEMLIAPAAAVTGNSKQLTPHSPPASALPFPPASYASPPRNCTRSSTSVEVAGLDAGAFDDAEEGLRMSEDGDGESQFADADEEVVWPASGRTHPASLFRRGPWAGPSSPRWSGSSLSSGLGSTSAPVSQSGSLRSPPAWSVGSHANSTFSTAGLTASASARPMPLGLGAQEMDSHSYTTTRRADTHVSSVFDACTHTAACRRF